jgi:RNA polymerase sigma-70 factor (ECF subfamily)
VTAEAPPPGAAGRPRPAPPPEDERDLIRRAQAGDLAAFEPLVERYRERVWRLALQLLRDREEAWDCAQEVFVRAFHSIASFRGDSAFYTWLFRITVNLATDRQRARGAQARAFGGERVDEEEWSRTVADPAAGPEDAAVSSERRARISAALDALPPKARTIIMLSDIEGLSYREIAEVLRCPIGTVMSRLHNARKRLKALLGPMLLVVLSLLVGVLGPPPRADAQPIIRFGVRVLAASNVGEVAPPPAVRPRPPVPPLAGPPAPDDPGAASRPAPAPAPEDHRVARLMPQLRAVFRYNDYTTLQHYRVEGPIGAAQRFSIVGERWLEVTPDQLLGKGVRMRVRLLKGDQTVMTANIVAMPGAPALIGGPPHGDGVLIIVLWANPNPRP